MKPHQSFHFDNRVPSSAYEYGERKCGERHGLVLTKPHVVKLILDLIGYTEERPLWRYRLLEPSCGRGAFVVSAAGRLIAAAVRDGVAVGDLRHAMAGVDIDANNLQATKSALIATLRGRGFSDGTAQSLVSSWLCRGDFLLSSTDGTGFDFVVGNPPYIRIENIADALQAEYRARFRSLYDRADLYVAFIEKGLQLLNPNGVLSFVCSDRWTSNKYGSALRQIVSQDFAVKAYIDLHEAAPFQSDVSAYPSIFVIERSKQSAVAVSRMKSGSARECAAVSRAVLNALKSGRSTARSSGRVQNGRVQRHATWFRGREPWVLSSPQQVESLRLLEEKNTPIEADGQTRVSIGVATGADSVFIVDDTHDIEADRLVPLVMRKNIANGAIENARRYVINTFAADGAVVDLDGYPNLRAYLMKHRDAVMRRHVAKKNPSAWFRTIDRIHVDRVRQPKLLIPDIAGANQVTLDNGNYYPHHNLYYVLSSAWDLSVLGGLLSSRVALFFIWSYATKMRGGYLRFQAQYLRRICVPNPRSIPQKLANSIRRAFHARDFAALDRLSLKAYGIERLPEFDFVDTRR